MNNQIIQISTVILLTVFLFMLKPSTCSSQNDFELTQCVDVEEVIAMIDTVLLGNVDPVFKKNITFSGDPGAVGYYTGGETFGFVESAGIVISNGFSGMLDLSNDCASQNASGNNAGGTDADLSMLTSLSINDACIIEFDMMLFHDSVFLSYIFGSEEYHDYVNTQFNDVFGFFISGPGINGPFSNDAKNIAVVPGTNNYVSINNINCGNMMAGCNQTLPGGTNCELLYDNTQTDSDRFTQVALDAFTLPLTTEQEIQSYEWYHFKLAIGDAGDAAYDSGVFLEKGSVISIPVPEFNLTEAEDEEDVIKYIDTVLLRNVYEGNKANISFVGDPGSFGYYNNTSVLGFEQHNGVLFTSGFAGNANAVNECNSTANASSDNNGIDIDPDLAVIANNIPLTDISIIEFDYRPSSDTINLTYVFASEEYHEMIGNDYNDVFGFFLSGPGIDGEFSNNAVNIATVQGQNLPVNSSTINFGIGGVTCTGKPEGCLNCEYMVDNSQKHDDAFFRNGI